MRKKEARAPYPLPSHTLGKLTTLQTQVAELASDLIMNGGHEDDVNNLLDAVLAHCWRRKFTDHQTPEQCEKDAPKNAERNRAEWFRRLSGYWPGNAIQRSDEALPTTVAEMARANARGVLRERFNEFMGDVEDLGDVFLLSETLCGFIGGTRPLAEAFAYHVDRSGVYIKIPEKGADTIVEILRNYHILKDRNAELEAFARKVRVMPKTLNAA